MGDHGWSKRSRTVAAMASAMALVAVTGWAGVADAQVAPPTATASGECDPETGQGLIVVTIADNNNGYDYDVWIDDELAVDAEPVIGEQDLVFEADNGDYLVEVNSLPDGEVNLFLDTVTVDCAPIETTTTTAPTTTTTPPAPAVAAVTAEPDFTG